MEVIDQQRDVNNDARSVSIDKHDDSTGESKDILLAACYIREAVRSRNTYIKTEPEYIRSYELYNHWILKLSLYVCIWGNLLLAVFEKPEIPGAEIPYWGTMIMELLFVGFFVARFAHGLHYSQRSRYWRDLKNIVILATVALIIIDMFCYVLWVNLADDSSAALAVRWSRPFRPLFLVNFPEGRQLRKAFRNIRRTLPDIFHVFILLLASISLFALLAFKLFQNRNLSYPTGHEYFNNYWEVWWDLYVLVTTANSPDVMVPGYNESDLCVLFFIVYIIINVYIFMNIVLASIYNNYKKHLKNEVFHTISEKQLRLQEAFDILKSTPRGEGGASGKEGVTMDQWHRVMALVDPKRSPIELDLLFYVLDVNGDDLLEKADFSKVTDVLSVQIVTVKSDQTFLEKYLPKLYSSQPSEWVKMVVKTKYFHWFFDLMILINAILIGLSIEEAEWFFLPLFVIEILLYLYTLGAKKFFTTPWHVFDFVVVTTALAVTIVDAIMGKDSFSSRFFDFLMVVRLLKLVRLFGTIERFRIILTTVLAIGPSILTYGVVIFIIYYVYAVIGMELFHGLISHVHNSSDPMASFCGNVKLNGSEFAAKLYCKNNFNNVYSSFVLLFELTVVNQWHVLAEGHVYVTNKAARLYFLSFHVACVLIILNIFTAFVIEIFLLEYNISKGKLASVIETKIREMGLDAYPSVSPLTKIDKKVLVTEEIGSSDDATRRDNGYSPGTEAGHSPKSGSPLRDYGIRFKLKETGGKNVETLLKELFEFDSKILEENGPSILH